MKSLLRDEIFPFILRRLVFVFICIKVVFTYLFYEEIKALMNLEL